MGFLNGFCASFSGGNWVEMGAVVCHVGVDCAYECSDYIFEYPFEYKFVVDQFVYKWGKFDESFFV